MISSFITSTISTANEMTQQISTTFGKKVAVAKEGQKTSSQVAKSNNTKKMGTKEESLPVHLSQFIDQFRNRVENEEKAKIKALVVKKWSNFTRLCKSFGDSAIVPVLTDSEIAYFFLEEGICMGMSFDYLGQFFKKRSPLTISPFPLRETPHLDIQSGVKFYPFVINKQTLEEQTRRFRFLQVAYKIAYATNKSGVNSLEIVPSNILRQNKLKIAKRIPDPQTTQKFSFKIENLVPELKKLISQDSHKAYILAIGGSAHHALTVYFHSPFHFVDPSNGIAIANSEEDLILFLANYLSEKYSSCLAFGLLELEYKKPSVEIKNSSKGTKLHQKPISTKISLNISQAKNHSPKLH